LVSRGSFRLDDLVDHEYAAGSKRWLPVFRDSIAFLPGWRYAPYEPARRQRSCHVPRTGVCPPHL